MKKKIIIFLLVLFILLGIYMLYNTFAISSIASNITDNVYDIDLNDSSTITVSKNSNKTVYYHIKNTNNGKVRYGVGYNTSSNIEVFIYYDSKDKAEDIIGHGDNKYIKLYLSNRTSSDSSVTISTILGYENGGDLIVDNSITLVTKVKPPSNLAKYITWLYTNSDKAVVTNNSITYNYATDVSLMNDRLGGTTTDLDGGNIRYYGASPNNYIYFNCTDYSNQTSDTCELWRIIGVFDGKVKIIRNSTIGSYSWDTSAANINGGNGVNEWSQADLMKLLNPGYESESVGGSLYYNSKSGTCYSGPSNATKSCDFTSTGIKNEETKKKIAIGVTWNTGGWNTGDIYSNEMYNYERGNTLISNPSDGITRNPVWKGKIAIPYPSDYGYAADLSSCSKTLYYYDSSTNSYLCRSNDWMYPIITDFGSSYGWFITPYSDNTMNASFVSSAGHFNTPGNTVQYMRSISPVLYLDSNLSIVDDTLGTIDKPYKINNT